eukprot:gene28304-13176_t
MPGDERTKPKRLKILDEIAQQVCIQHQESGEDHDVMPLVAMHVGKMVKHYVSEEDVEAAALERNKAVENQQAYELRCRVAEEQSENEKTDKEAIKKSMAKRVARLAKENEKLVAKTTELEDKIIMLQKQLSEQNAGSAAPTP